MMEWVRRGRGREERKERGNRNDPWTRFDEGWKLLRRVLLFDKLKNGGASGSFEVWHGSANWPEQWGATQKRKPTKSFNHRAASLLFLLAAAPCLCKKTFFLPLLFFSFHACFVAPHVYFQLMKLRFKKRVSIPIEVRRTRLHKWIIK